MSRTVPQLEQLEVPAVELTVLPDGAAGPAGAQEVTPAAEAVVEVRVLASFCFAGG